jgi:hypothetical protein
MAALAAMNTKALTLVRAFDFSGLLMRDNENSLLNLYN